MYAPRWELNLLSDAFYEKDKDKSIAARLIVFVKNSVRYVIEADMGRDRAFIATMNGKGLAPGH
jgi:hypothetical protein